MLLDAQDWMNAETMIEPWTAIAEKAERGSRIIFRTAGSAISDRDEFAGGTSD